MKIAGEEALRQNIAKTKEYVQQHSGGGHTIITASSLPMAGQPNLQFEDVHVENVGQAGQGKTVIKPQFHVCATKAEWDAMSPAEQDDPLVYWVRPWANSDAFATDRTPVGTVISIGCELSTIDPQDSLISFPNNDYLICKGTVCNITSYPQLANYIESAYGSKNYFGGDGTSTFAVPDWSADFPENGILCIKAQISSTAITYHEIDQSGIYAGEDKVPSCARVAEIENEISTIQDLTSSIAVVSPTLTPTDMSETKLYKCGNFYILNVFLKYSVDIGSANDLLRLPFTMPGRSYLGTITDLYGGTPKICKVYSDGLFKIISSVPANHYVEGQIVIL